VRSFYVTREHIIVFMPTLAYLDSSGWSQPSTIGALCCICANEQFWYDFNRTWNDHLRRLDLKCWHTTDLLRKPGGDSSMRRVPDSLLNAMMTIATAEAVICSIAVNKADETAFRRRHSDLPPIEEICVGFCFNKLGIARGDADQANCLRVMFDQGEPFIRYLKHPWLAHRRKARQLGGWPAQVKEIEPARAEDHPGLQAADLIVWGVRRHYETPDQTPDWDAKQIILCSLMTGKHYHGFFNATALERLFVKKERINFNLSYDLLDRVPSSPSDHQNRP